MDFFNDIESLWVKKLSKFTIVTKVFGLYTIPIEKNTSMHTHTHTHTHNTHTHSNNKVMRYLPKKKKTNNGIRMAVYDEEWGGIEVHSVVIWLLVPLLVLEPRFG